MASTRNRRTVLVFDDLLTARKDEQVMERIFETTEAKRVFKRVVGLEHENFAEGQRRRWHERIHRGVEYARHFEILWHRHSDIARPWAGAAVSRHL